GLAHSGSAPGRYLVPLGFLGFVLCLVRWRTSSLYPCIALHSLNNALALGVGQLNWNAGQALALVRGSVAPVLPVPLPLSGPPPRAPPRGGAEVRVSRAGACFGRRRPVPGPRRSFHVGGVVPPYVPGQLVTVKVMLGRHVVKAYKLRVKPSRNHRFGHFREH